MLTRGRVGGEEDVGPLKFSYKGGRFEYTEYEQLDLWQNIFDTF